MGRMRELFAAEQRPYNGAAPFQKHSETSTEAAKGIEKKIGPLHQKILEWLKNHPAGATDERLCAELDLEGNTLRPRRRELELMKKIFNSGRTEATQSGRQAVVWVLS